MDFPKDNLCVNLKMYLFFIFLMKYIFLFKNPTTFNWAIYFNNEHSSHPAYQLN